MHVNIASAVILIDGKLICLDNRKLKKLTFPMGKVEMGESPEIAIDRELLEELNITVIKKGELTVLTFPHFERSNLLLINHIFYIEEFSGLIKNKEPENHLAIHYLTELELITLAGENKLDNFLQHFYKQLNKE
jgi:mutator protein MutT